MHTADYLERIGVGPLPARTTPFDPGYDLATVTGHLEQSSHLMAGLKISMACWLVADEAVSRKKVAAAAEYGVRTVTGGGPFEIALAQGELPSYLDLCADMGMSAVECGAGFTTLHLSAGEIVGMAHDRGLEVEFELGGKHSGPFTDPVVDELIVQGREWLDAGAVQLVLEARESAQGVGFFDMLGRLNVALADRFAEAFGLERLIFEAPTKHSQFDLMRHFGAEVRLANVRLEELLRVEIFRRGLHSDSFADERLSPQRVPSLD